MQKLFDIFDHPFLGRGFRPFFFLGAFYSFIMLFIWGGVYSGFITLPGFLLTDSVSWHAHEMLYGYTMAIVAGFLLTAVANWTKQEPVRGGHLFSLCVVWLFGRIVINFDIGLPFWVVYLVVSSFIPFLIVSLSIPLLESWNKRNFIFILVLGSLSILQIIFLVLENRDILYVSLMMIMVMISLIGGRIIPAFTVNALRERGHIVLQVPQNNVDIISVFSLIITAICFILYLDGIFLFLSAIFSAALHIFRMRHYHSFKAFSDPMLWILHIGFIWLIIALILLALSALEVLPLYLVTHAFTAGAIGSMTIGMMVRVALGHTGRKIIANKFILIMFCLMQLMAVIRVFGPILLPDFNDIWIISSAIIWSLCFALYLLLLAPVLLSRRIDGQEA